MSPYPPLPHGPETPTPLPTPVPDPAAPDAPPDAPAGPGEPDPKPTGG
ncbi:hypothetical protein [Azospirillum sp.]|nr:hypothetical protein [Azospirillum sp.]HYD65070.1 hypothetical protein [Azospirillum sp.]